MQYILFEDKARFEFLPLSYTRAVCELRLGIYSFTERWEHWLQEKVAISAHRILGLARPQTSEAPTIWINGRFAPDDEARRWLAALQPGEYIHKGEEVYMAYLNPFPVPAQWEGWVSRTWLDQLGLKAQEVAHTPLGISRLTDLYTQNRAFIVRDVEWLRARQQSETIRDPYTRIYGADNLFVSPGTKVKAAILNAEDGPIYLGPNASILEGAIIRNAHVIGAHATVSAGAKLRGDSTIGPRCKVGGEVGNSVFLGNANKSHDGYLGNSVIGQWCNLGADTNSSNLKNNYSSVSQWNYVTNDFISTGQQFCGLTMGDHSKCGINTMFNTGTVVGVFANIFGGGFPPRFVPSFSWGGGNEWSTYRFEKAIEVAEIVMSRRSKKLEATDRDLLKRIMEETRVYRTWEDK